MEHQVQSVSLANAALVFLVALASVQLAILCLSFARRGNHAAAAQWWAAALVAHAVRLALTGAGESLPASNATLIQAAGHAPVAMLIYAGTLALSRPQAWRLPLVAATVATGLAIVAAPLYGGLVDLAGIVLSATAAAALLAAGELLWTRYRAERWNGYFAAQLPLLCTGLYVLVGTASALRVLWSGAVAVPHGWGLTIDLGLFTVTLIGLVHVLYARAYRDACAAEFRLRDSIESLPIGAALFDADDRLVACNSIHRTLHPLAPATAFQAGRHFGDIVRILADAGVYQMRGEGLERYIENRVSIHKRASGDPIIVTLSDGRSLQVNETKTAGGDIVSAWTDITALKRRERSLAILIAQDLQGRTMSDVAAEALAVGLDCRWVGVAEIIEDNRARVLSMITDGQPQATFEYDIEGTPSAHIGNPRDYCLFPDHLPQRFPDNKFVASVGAVSYRGHAIRDAAGEKFGFIFAMDGAPMVDGRWQKDFIALVARWLGMTYQTNQAERELRESQQRFQDFAESTSDWFWEMDENLRFSYFSDGLAEKFHVDPQYLLGKTREELLATGDPISGDILVSVDWDAHLADLRAHQPFRNFVHPRVQPNGSTRYVSLDGRPIFDHEGNFRGYRGTVRDVTNPILAEHAVRESEARLRKAQEQAKIGYWRWSLKDEKLVYWSQAAAQIGGMDPNESDISYSYEDTIKTVHPDDRDRVLAEYRAADRECRDFEVDYRVIWPNGEVRYLHEFGQIEHGDNGEPIAHTGIVQDVTDLKRAEEALRNSQMSLANAQRIARIGSWDWNIVTNELSWSDEIYRMFGLTPQEFGATYDAFMESVYPRDRAAVQKAVEEALAGAPYSIDHRIVHPDGLVRIVHEQGEVDFDAGGKPVFMRGTVQDVTEQRQALSALAEREQRIRAITDNAGDALVTIDTMGTIKSVNPATEQIFGYTADEMIGRNISMLMGERDRDQHDAYLDRYLQTGEATIVGLSGRELVGQRKDGTPVDVEILVNEMFYGRKKLFLGTIRDITERIGAREAERRKVLFVELSKAVSTAANEATSLPKALQTGVDQVCRLLDWPLGHAYLVSSRDSGVLQSSGLWHAADPELYSEFIDLTNEARFAAGKGVPGRLLQTGQAQYLTNTEQDDGDPRVACARRLGLRAIFAFPIKAGPHITGAIEFFSTEPGELEPATVEVMEYVGAQLGHVAERAMAERSLMAAKDAAENANLAKTNFLATMSHELRTPLNAIIGFSELMMDETFGPLGHKNYKDYADGILSSGSHLLNIINDILDVAKTEAGRIVLAEEAVNLGDVIEAALAQVRSSAETKGLTLDVDLQPNALRVRVDKLRIKQILLNLLSNSVKFTARGSITVRQRPTPDGGVSVQVIDTGIGISEQDVERVFEPFTQADTSLQRSHEGTGLGLPLSRSLANLHGGTLTLESEIDAGTTATLSLPPERVLKNASAA